MKNSFSLKMKLAQNALRILILFVTIGVLITSCSFAPRGFQNLFRSNESTPTATEIFNLPKEGFDTSVDQADAGQVNETPSKTTLTHTNTPSFTPSETVSLTFSLTFTHTASVTSTNTFLNAPPTYTSTYTRIPPTNTSAQPSNTPIPPSATPTATDTQVTEPPTQEPTDEPTEEPTETLICYMLILTHEGEGTDPVANPKYSTGCSNNHYVVGEIISLSNAIPAANWEIERWSGTLQPKSTADTNRVKMPSGDHTAAVVYAKCG